MDASSSSSSSSVIGPHFCSSQPVELIFSRKAGAEKRKCLAATDVYGNNIFREESQRFSARHRSILIEAASGTPLVSMQKKLLDPYGKWEVFRGNSFDYKDLLFTVQRTSVLGFNSKLNVFLVTNTNKKDCDFRIEGRYFKRSCKVYRGNTDTVLAQMNSETRGENFSVYVDVDVDSAFIAALIFVRHKFHKEAKMEILSLALSGGDFTSSTYLSLARKRLL